MARINTCYKCDQPATSVYSRYTTKQGVRTYYICKHCSYQRSLKNRARPGYRERQRIHYLNYAAKKRQEQREAMDKQTSYIEMAIEKNNAIMKKYA